MIGQAVGALIFTPMADKIGRKPVHVFCHICLFITVSVTSFVPSYPWFAVMRAVTGVFQEVHFTYSTCNGVSVFIETMVEVLKRIHELFNL